MPLLDGKYEILSQDVISSSETHFKALAPDGNSLNIIWYEFKSLEDEQLFEQFRKLIRQLRKDNLAAVYDIVSRPGAHYIAWLDASNLSKASSTKKIDDLLAEYSYSSQMADIRSSKSKRKIYGLDFAPKELVLRSKSAVEAIPKRIKVDKRPFYLHAASILLVFVSTLIIFLALQISSNDRSIVLADLLGQDVNHASKLLKNQNLNVVLIPSPSAKKIGEVISMEPKAGDEIRPFYRTVHLSYAAPTGQLGMVQVIDLVGTKLSANTSVLLEQNSLSLGKVYFISSSKPVKTILAQSKAIASQVDSTEEIDILVSNGVKKELSFLPQLIGMSIEDARFFVGLSGLRVEEVFERSRIKANTVIGQSIAAFATVNLDDSSIKLYISQGPEGEISSNRDITPSLLGLSLEEAKHIAQNYQFNIRKIDAPELANGIFFQNPEAGSNKTDNTINILVNNYIPPLDIPIPNITAQLQEKIARNLEYAWATEANISVIDYEVLAILANGQTISVQKGRVKGGEIVSGSWLTNSLGPVRFKLYLNGFQYSIEIIRN